MERSKVWEAAQKHKDGYNCCQAVVCTYCERLGMDEKTAFRAAEAYGLGIAGMFQTCGSVCGMMMLAGLKNSDANMESPASKFATFDLGKEMAKRFEQRNTSMICNDLRGTDARPTVCVLAAAVSWTVHRLWRKFCSQVSLNHTTDQANYNKKEEPFGSSFYAEKEKAHSNRNELLAGTCGN